MHGKCSILMLAASSALALALTGCGPGGNNEAPRRGSTPTQPAGFPPQVSSSTEPPPAPQQVETNPTAAQSTINRPVPEGPGFSQIAGTKGYITRKDAERMPWLEIHFSQCDTNKDGHITLQEFNECRRRLAEPKVGQPNAAKSG